MESLACFRAGSMSEHLLVDCEKTLKIYTDIFSTFLFYLRFDTYHLKTEGITIYSTEVSKYIWVTSYKTVTEIFALKLAHLRQLKNNKASNDISPELLKRCDHPVILQVIQRITNNL